MNDENNKEEIEKINAHPGFDDSEIMFRSTLGETGNLALIFAKVSQKDRYLLGIGDGADPLSLTHNELIYLIRSLSGVSQRTLKKTGTFNQAALTSEDTKPNIKEVSPRTRKTLEEIQDLINTADMAKESLEGDDLDIESEEYDQAKAAAKDMAEIFNSLSPEEKEILDAEMQKKSQELVTQKARALEKMLLGDIKEEQAIVYDYEYFKNIHATKGKEFLREELAKIPKAERKEIINKIVTESKQQVQND